MTGNPHHTGGGAQTTAQINTQTVHKWRKWTHAHSPHTHTPIHSRLRLNEPDEQPFLLLQERKLTHLLWVNSWELWNGTRCDLLPSHSLSPSLRLLPLSLVLSLSVCRCTGATHPSCVARRKCIDLSAKWYADPAASTSCWCALSSRLLALPHAAAEGNMRMGNVFECCSTLSLSLTLPPYLSLTLPPSLFSLSLPAGNARCSTLLSLHSVTPSGWTALHLSHHLSLSLFFSAVSLQITPAFSLSPSLSHYWSTYQCLCLCSL